ncbi:MAG: outer membrane beta-barrel protein [Acidobacteriota bacterium]
MAQPALAQNTASHEDSGIGIGVEGMITHTSFRGTNADNLFKGRSGEGFGLWIGGNKNGLIGFTGEFVYLIRHFGAKGDPNEVKANALEIPAVFHINFGQRSKNGIAAYAIVGPVFTINLKQKLVISDLDISNNFSGADIGVIGGAGVEFYRVGIEARGNWGLRNISDSGDTNNLKTFTFELVGKFRFN